MNVYSYIKAQNYQGFDVDIVRKILIQLMQALLFLHHVAIMVYAEKHNSLRYQTRECSFQGIGKIWCQVDRLRVSLFFQSQGVHLHSEQVLSFS